MKIKIEDKCFRFKISEKELSLLLDGKAVSMKSPILDKNFMVVITPEDNGGDMGFNLSTDDNDVCLDLFVSTASLRDLLDMGRSRGGIKQSIGSSSVTLQVDLRGDKRKAS